MPASWRSNRFTARLGLDVPLMSGAFGGLSSVALTAAVSNAGGLGAFGLYGYSPERIAETTAELRDATDRPFLLNLWVLDDADTRGPEDSELAERIARLRPIFEELGLAPPAPPQRYLPSFADQLEAVLSARPAAAGFVFGAPDSTAVERLHAAGILLVGTATTVDEAVALEAAGMDVIIASGSEAGGHRVSFLRPADESLVGTIALVPQVVDAVSVPVIAAGGIADGRGVAAATMLGAEGVQVGSALLTASESAAPESYRRAIASERARTTVLTRASSGRLGRAIPNRMTREIGEQTAPFPIQNWLTGAFRKVAAERDEAELMTLWCGQAGPLATMGDAAAMVRRLTDEADALLDPLAG